MSVDIRNYTRIIIRKNRLFLSRKEMLTNTIVWNNSTYEAWFTRDKHEAAKMALKTGGTMMLFNPIIGKTAVM